MYCIMPLKIQSNNTYKGKDKTMLNKIKKLILKFIRCSDCKRKGSYKWIMTWKDSGRCVPRKEPICRRCYYELLGGKWC